MTDFEQPAFPHPSGGQGCDGLTKREWFAGMALIGMGTWSPLKLFDLDTDEARKTRAMFAVQQADALIAELAK